MTNELRELDAQIARALGLPVRDGVIDLEDGRAARIPAYSTDPAAAAGLRREMAARGWDVFLAVHAGGETAEAEFIRRHHPRGKAVGATEHEATARAALAALQAGE